MPSIRNKDILLYSFFLSLLFLLYKGYTFNSWDQAECLPQVYKLLDPSLYSNDFFILEYQRAFTVRFYFVYFIYALSYLFSVPAVCFALTVISLFLSIYFFVRITQHFTDNRIAAFISPVFALFFFFNFTVGGNHVQNNAMIPGTIAAVLAIIGIYLFLKNKYAFSFFILGVGTLFQPLVTLQVFMVLVLMLVIDVKHIGLTKTLKAVCMYFLPASLMLAPIIYRQFFQHEVYDKTLYYEVLYRFRNHLHYLPSLFPLKDYLKFSALVVAALAATRFIKIRDGKFIYRFCSLIIAGALFYWLLLEVINVFGMGKLQWFKATVWVNGIACIVLAVFIGNYLEKFFKPGIIKLISPLSVAGSILLLFALLSPKLIPIEKLQGRYQVGNYKKSDLTLLHEWMKQNLSKDAVILCTTENTSLICEAQRSQVVQYQAIIHEPFYMLPWYERFKEVYGVGIETADRKDIRKQAAELYLSRNYKGRTYHIDYRIDDVSTCKYVSELGPIIHQSGNYILTEYIAE